MKYFSFLFVLLTFSTHLSSQSIYNIPNIQTTVAVDTLVLPDEILLQFSISGTKDDFKKHKYEEQIIKELEEIDPTLSEDFKIANLQANTFKTLLIISNKKQNRIYNLKSNSFMQIEPIIEVLQNIGVKDISIEYFNISNRDEILNELRAKAIEIAENHAKSLLRGKSQKVGRILEIKDLRGENDSYMNSIITGNLGSNQFKLKEESEIISFKKIKLEKIIEVRFEIK